MTSRIGFYGLILIVALLTAVGLGMLDQGSEERGGQAVAAPLAGVDNIVDGDGDNAGDDGDGDNEGDDEGDNEEPIIIIEPAAAPPPPAPAPPPPPAPPAPVVVVQQPAPGPCTFVLGFAFLHAQLGGIDGVCGDNEHPDPNGTGDQVQTTIKPDGSLGYMVWQAFTNTMRWTDGFQTFTYSACGLQQRLNTQTFVWETNQAIARQGVPPAPGTCNVV
jgi:hypothetical protein